MKSGSKFNQDILGKRLRDDANKWNIDPSASSSRETLASVRKAFREPQTGKGPALMPAFAAAMALVLIIAVVQTLKGPDASVDKNGASPPTVAMQSVFPELPSTNELVERIPTNPIERELFALEQDVRGTIDFLITLVPLSES